MTSLRCPECGSHRIGRYVWGYPNDRDYDPRSVERGDLIIGGCMVLEPAPDFRCRNCEHEWRSDGQSVFSFPDAVGEKGRDRS